MSAINYKTWRGRPDFCTRLSKQTSCRTPLAFIISAGSFPAVRPILLSREVERKLCAGLCFSRIRTCNLRSSLCLRYSIRSSA